MDDKTKLRRLAAGALLAFIFGVLGVTTGLILHTTPPAEAPKALYHAPPYLTAPEDAEVMRWSQVGDVWLSTEPLFDSKTGLYAHMDYKGASEAVARLGAELPSREDIIALHEQGLELAPVTLPDALLLQHAGIPAHNTTAVDAFRNANMLGLEWAQLHDARVQDQLVARNWDGIQPVANAGKHWICCAPKGRAFLMGWWVGGPHGHWIQSGIEAATPGSRGPHDWGHHDYGTTTVAKRRTAPN